MAGSRSVEAKALAESKAVTVTLADRSLEESLSTADVLEVPGEGARRFDCRVKLAMLLSILDVLIIKCGKVGSGFAVGTKKLIKLGMESLSVAVSGSINEQRHEPHSERRHGGPAENLR